MKRGASAIKRVSQYQTTDGATWPSWAMARRAQSILDLNKAARSFVNSEMADLGDDDRMDDAVHAIVAWEMMRKFGASLLGDGRDE